MDLRQLEVFCRLMDTRSFSLAARELKLAQPTVSSHMKSLEAELGVSLFDRRDRRVRPTGAAEVLVEYARRMVALRQEARQALDRFRGRIGGPLRVGGSTIPSVYLLPAVMGRFRERYPEAGLELIQSDTAGIVELIEEGSIEVGLVGAALDRADLIFEPIHEDLMVVVAPANAQWPDPPAFPVLDSDQTWEIADLIRVPFILREEGSGTRRAMETALARVGLTSADLNVAAVMGSSEAVRQAVKNGLGVSILSRLAVDDLLTLGLIRLLSVRDLFLPRVFHLVHHRHRTRSPVGEAFLSFLREEALCWPAVA